LRNTRHRHYIENKRLKEDLDWSVSVSCGLDSNSVFCLYNIFIRWDFGVASLSSYIYYIMIDIWSELKEAIGVSSFTINCRLRMLTQNTERGRRWSSIQRSVKV